MTDAPERIWVDCAETLKGTHSIGVIAGDEPPTDGYLGDTQYLRADTAIPVAEVRALVGELEAAAENAYQATCSSEWTDEQKSQLSGAADAKRYCAAELRQLMGEG